jgi:hypothetical protein
LRVLATVDYGHEDDRISLSLHFVTILNHIFRRNRAPGFWVRLKACISAYGGALMKYCRYIINNLRVVELWGESQRLSRALRP